MSAGVSLPCHASPPACGPAPGGWCLFLLLWGALAMALSLRRRGPDAAVGLVLPATSATEARLVDGVPVWGAVKRIVPRTV